MSQLDQILSILHDRDEDFENLSLKLSEIATNQAVSRQAYIAIKETQDADHKLLRGNGVAGIAGRVELIENTVMQFKAMEGRVIALGFTIVGAIIINVLSLFLLP